MFLYLGAYNYTCIFEVGIEHSHKGGKSFLGSFKDEVPQTGLRESLDKIAIFKGLLIQIVRLKYFSFDLEVVKVCFLLLG